MSASYEVGGGFRELGYNLDMSDEKNAGFAGRCAMLRRREDDMASIRLIRARQYNLTAK